MQTSELVRLTVKELQALAKKLGIKEISGVRKQDLIKLILDFSNNTLTYLPENICEIYANLTSFNIGLNYICPPYPDCLNENDCINNDSNLTEGIDYAELNGFPGFQGEQLILKLIKNIICCIFTTI